MKFNPFRQIFQYDNQVTIIVKHAIDTKFTYGHVTLGNDFKVNSYTSFPQHAEQMDLIMRELHQSLQEYANRWKFFYRTPRNLMTRFVKQNAFSRNPNNL